MAGSILGLGADWSTMERFYWIGCQGFPIPKGSQEVPKGSQGCPRVPKGAQGYHFGHQMTFQWFIDDDDDSSSSSSS